MTTPSKARILPCSLSCHLQLGITASAMKYWKIGYIFITKESTQ